MGRLFVSHSEGFGEERSAARELQLEMSRSHVISVTNKEDHIMSHEGKDRRDMLST